MKKVIVAHLLLFSLILYLLFINEDYALNKKDFSQSYPVRFRPGNLIQDLKHENNVNSKDASPLQTDKTESVPVKSSSQTSHQNKSSSDQTQIENDDSKENVNHFSNGTSTDPNNNDTKPNQLNQTNIDSTQENNSKQNLVSSSNPKALNLESLKGDSESEVKWIFQTKDHEEYENSTCSPKDKRNTFLCRIGLNNNCKSNYLAEQLSTFWIICPIYSANHDKTSRLYDLHRNFRSYIMSYGINFQTVEVIFPGQEFQLTKPNNEPYDLQYRDEWIFAMRENLVNVGIKHLPEDWQFVSWIDQHIFWMDPYWFEKSIWLMSHYNIVHLLNGNDFLNLTNGTDYSLGGVVKKYYEIGPNYWRYIPQQWGLAWATNKEIYEKLGGLLDICIGTKCDFYQAVTYTKVKYTQMTLNEDFNNMLGAWQDHAIKVYDGKVGYLDSNVLHFMHCRREEGCKTSEYDAQIGLMIRHNFHPDRDLKRDSEGRLSLINVALAKDMWKLYGGDPS